MARGPYHDLQSMDCAPGDINSVCTHSDELNKGLPTALRLSARHFNSFFISVVFRVFHLSCNSVFGRLHFVFFHLSCISSNSTRSVHVGEGYLSPRFFRVFHLSCNSHNNDNDNNNNNNNNNNNDNDNNH